MFLLAHQNAIEGDGEPTSHTTNRTWAKSRRQLVRQSFVGLLLLKSPIHRHYQVALYLSCPSADCSIERRRWLPAAFQDRIYFISDLLGLMTPFSFAHHVYIIHLSGGAAGGGWVHTILSCRLIELVVHNAYIDCCTLCGRHGSELRRTSQFLNGPNLI